MSLSNLEGSHDAWCTMDLMQGVLVTVVSVIHLLAGTETQASTAPAQDGAAATAHSAGKIRDYRGDVGRARALSFH
jgi:hypothetical protein